MSQITIHKQDYNDRDGLSIVTRIFKNKVLVKESGVHANYFSMVVCDMRYGGVHRLPDRYRDSINAAIQTLSMRLMQVRIDKEGSIDQIRSLGKWVMLPHLFQCEMHWTFGKMNGRIRQKSASCYGKFSEEELRSINEAIARMAFTAMQIHLVSDVQENTPQSKESSIALQESSNKTD